MMNLELHRYAFGDDSTLGRLSIDGEFECFTLEDERRTVKVRGETCIPPGQYEILLRTEGGLHTKYAERFPETHKGMLWFQDVPGFTYIYLHIGNRENQTDGCPLVGVVPVILPDGEFEIARSGDAYTALYAKVVAALDADERVWVHVTESVR